MESTRKRNRSGRFGMVGRKSGNRRWKFLRAKHISRGRKEEELIMKWSDFGDRELDALIADRMGDRVFGMLRQGRYEFYVRRGDRMVAVAPFTRDATLLESASQSAVWPKDATAREMFIPLLATHQDRPRELAEAFVRIFIGQPDERLAWVRSREDGWRK